MVWIVPQAVATFQTSSNDSILSCFSIPDNAKRTFSTRRESPNLHVVHGLEFLLFFTIVSGMVYNFMLPYIGEISIISVINIFEIIIETQTTFFFSKIVNFLFKKTEAKIPAKRRLI